MAFYVILNARKIWILFKTLQNVMSMYKKNQNKQFHLIDFNQPMELKAQHGK